MLGEQFFYNLNYHPILGGQIVSKMLTDRQKRYHYLKTKYDYLLKNPLSLTMTRGLPDKDQLNLSTSLLTNITPEDYETEDHKDIRNYGELTGILEAKHFFSAMLGVTTDEVFVGGNSSLSLLHMVLTSLLYSKNGPSLKDKGPLTFLCPSPGYDRHFAMTEKLGITMIPVPMTDVGPDMDIVEELVATDASIKGIWCVPTYSNPTGVTYSDETVDRLAQLETLADDFIILWDNAYVAHHLTEDHTIAKNILASCKAAGYPNRPWMVCSTSKITFPGAGVAALASSEENIAFFSHEMFYQTIGFDKINQKRHVKFLIDQEHLAQHMANHAKLLKPKFDLITRKFRAYFSDRKMVDWTEPKGGYFVHLTTMTGCATDIVSHLSDIGVKVVKANSTYPYGINPLDNSIRLAPTSIPLEEVEQAIDAICLTIEFCCLRRQLEGAIDDTATPSSQLGKH